MENLNLESKEISIIKDHVTEVTQDVAMMRIKTAEDLETAKVMLTNIGSVQKAVKQTKDGMTVPINQALKSIRSFFEPMETKLMQSEAMVKEAMKIYLDKITPKIEAQKQAISDKVQAGEMKFETAVAKIERVEQKTAAIPTRTIKKIEIYSEKEIPREYLEINMVKLRADLLSGKWVPGARVITETIIIK